MRDRLRSGALTFAHLDAAQLVKHAFGIVSTARRRELAPALFYVFAEPRLRDGRPIDPAALAQYREEVQMFADEVEEDEVVFRFANYREWLSRRTVSDADLLAHRDAVLERFAP